MHCTECGGELPPGAHFCPSCGHVLAETGTAAPSPSTPAAQSAAVATAVAGKPGLWERFRAMKTWKKVALGCVVAIALIITLAMFATSGLDGPVDRHFAALKGGDLPAAYAELSIATQTKNPPDAFKAFIERNAVFTHVVGHTFTTRSWENGQGVLEGTLEIEGGGKLPIKIHLVKENGEWKILSYRVEAPKPDEK